MSETSHNLPQTLNEQASNPESLHDSRKTFVSRLVGNGLISDDLANSSELDAFIIDEDTNYDALSHILTGDENGGVHHLPTAMKLDMPELNIAVSSRIAGSKNISRGKLRDRQSVRPNGTFKPRIVTINGQEKDSGSAMFPNEWSTEEVIRNILTASQTAPSDHDLERGSYLHNAEIDGVDIQVITNETDGKIITAFPIVSRK